MLIILEFLNGTNKLIILHKHYNTQLVQNDYLVYNYIILITNKLKGFKNNTNTSIEEGKFGIKQLKIIKAGVSDMRLNDFLNYCH